MAFSVELQLAILKREEAFETRSNTIIWSTSAIFALGFSLAVLLLSLLVLASCFLLRRKAKFQFRQRNSAAHLAWSPVTTLNQTPFGSHSNTPIGPTPSDKKPLVRPSVLSRNTSFYTETVLNSPCAMIAKEIDIIGEDTVSYTKPREDEGDSDSESDVDDKRSISPLVMSPLLARLPSVKAAESTRVAELVRPGNLSRDEAAAFWVDDTQHSGNEASIPPKIDARMSVLERRSALFSPHEFPHLFPGKGSPSSPRKF